MRELYQLVWPFLLWGALIAVMYGVSFKKLASINEGIIAVKLGQRTLVQTSRVTYYTNEVALAQVGVWEHCWGSLPRHGRDCSLQKHGTLCTLIIKSKASLHFAIP